MTPVCQRNVGLKEIFTKEPELCGSYLVFDARAWRRNRVNSEMIPEWLHALLVTRPTAVHYDRDPHQPG